MTNSIRQTMTTDAVLATLLVGGNHRHADAGVIMWDTVAADFTPHHETDGHLVHDEHYFAETGDDHHYAWFSATPLTPGPITIKYDYRSQGGFANFITTNQKARAVDALNTWSAATGGKVVFVHDTVAGAADIINIGTGDLAALGAFTSGVGGILGLGGGDFDHGGGAHSITSGVAWQDFEDTWDTVIGNGNPGGTFDYFTVVAQEIGHALGLGHVDNIGGSNLMNGSYSSEVTAASASDVAHITSIYGATAAVPEPSIPALLSAGAIGLLVHRRRRQTLRV